MDAQQFAMASEWMVNGNINEFVKAHRDANRFGLVKVYSRCRPQPSLTATSDSSGTSLGGWCICMVRR